ncbi:MAG: TIGR02391 family protein [Candidatus Poribacteria bacterium]|nr:TIGR02391 family protein [Candidatus Poribacteria bacterium]
MRSRLISDRGETVTIVRLSDDKGEETIVASDVLCLISPVEGQYEHWQAACEVGNKGIRKGDILRRDNGLEMQVLRVEPGKLSRSREKIYLDLKEYDRVPQSSQMDVEDTLTDDLLPKRLLHHVVFQKVLPIFMQGSYGPAVFEAFKQVEVAVREAGGYAETDYGTKLMRMAFNPEDGALTDPQDTEKQARSDIFAGAIGSYKNPGSHRDVEITAEEAAELIIFASHLLRIVDSCNQ